MRNPQDQTGWIRAESGSWLGTYRVYDTRGKYIRKTRKLGAVETTTRLKAKQDLKQHIVRDNADHAIVYNSNRCLPLDVQSATLPPALQGAVSEYVTAVDLMRSGCEVFLPMCRASSCDLIAIKGETILRFEVKTGNPGQRVRVSRNIGKFNVLAFVDDQCRVRYMHRDAVPRGTTVVVPQNSENFDKLNVTDKPISVEGKGVN